MHEANTGGGKDSSGPPHWPAVFGVFARGMSLASSISKGMAATTTIMYVPYDDLERRAARAAAMHPGDPGRAYQHIKLSTVLVISHFSRRTGLEVCGKTVRAVRVDGCCLHGAVGAVEERPERVALPCPPGSGRARSPRRARRDGREARLI